MAAHLTLRGRTWRIIDGDYRRTTKTQDRELAEKVLDQYKRSRLGIPLVQKAVTSKLTKQFGLADSIVSFKQLRFPCVYAIFNDEELLYVGSSVNGLSRVLAHSHPMASIAQASDTVLIWATDSEGEARELEMKMIRAAKPKYNKAGVVAKRRMLPIRHCDKAAVS